MCSRAAARRSRELPRDEAREPEARDIAPAMKAVTSALASGAITPGEAERIATDACRNSKTRPRRAAARIAEAGSPWLYNR